MAKIYEYAVRVPIVGFIDVTVFSNKELSDAEALDLAYEQDGLSDPKKADHWEYEPVEHVTRGNVFYGRCNSVEVDLVDVDEAD